MARIDAHRLDRSGVSRLSYAGNVYHALVAGAGASREPYQVGAELFGHPGIAADFEVQSLLLQALAELGVGDFVFDLGHVGIFRGLTQGLPAALVDDLLVAMRGKNIPRIDELTAGLSGELRAALRALPLLCGELDVLTQARAVLPALPEVHAALDQLAQAASRLAPHTRLEIDLAELRGYTYHSGMVFAVYAPGFPGAVARGGRYDAIGLAFGRARPATGFSIDLRDLLPVMPAPASVTCAWLPLDVTHQFAEDALAVQLAALRAQGMVVVVQLDAADQSPDPRCTLQLVAQHGALVAQALTL